MDKLKSNIVNMAVSLSLISLFMSAALGFVYVKTKEPIAKAKEQKVKDAISVVVPKFNNNPNKEQNIINNLTVFPAKENNKIVGYAIKTNSTKGFAGNIEIMIGFLPNGNIFNISILDQKETPGLGTKMKEAKFKNQFNNKNPKSFKLSVKKDGGDVDAITAATITSRAFCDAIDKAYIALKKGGINE